MIDDFIPRSPIYVDCNLSFLVQKGIEYQGPFLVVINELCSDFFYDYFGIKIKQNDNINNCLNYLMKSTFLSKKNMNIIIVMMM